MNANFIFTEEARKRLAILFNYLEVGIPVLLEGPTGTSKTLSTEIVCEHSGRKLIHFNISSDTKLADLLGRYVFDSNSWGGISYSKGPFIIAFEEGHALLLEEINLASPEIIQFIEKTLDSRIISVELPGMPLKEIHIHENFRLIATKCPNEGSENNFLSSFQVINFPAYTQHELLEIAHGLATSFNCNCPSQFIDYLVDFHMELSKRAVNDAQCFTVREIAATIRAFENNGDIYETVMTIYGARYQEAKREELRKLFLSYPTFKNSLPKQFIYPKEFPNCFKNDSLSSALKNVLFSFENKRHVILSSENGAGVTQIAIWISQYFNKIHDSDDDHDIQEFLYVCNEATKCSDLIGKQELSDMMDSSNFPSKWMSGFLTKAIKKGKVAVLDNIDEAHTTVIERLKDLINQKYDDEVKYFEIPENPENQKVEINENFRLLCTCKIDKISQMSPAFINRFDVIVLENQLKDMTPTNLKELIKFLLQTTKFVKQCQPDTNDDDNDDDDDDDDDIDLFDGWEDEIEDQVEQFNPTDDQVNGRDEIKNSEMTQVEQFNPTDDQVNLVFNNIETSMTMSQIAQLCHAVVKYSKFFECEFFGDELIVHFAKDMLKKNEDFSFKGKYEKLQNFLLSHLQLGIVNYDNEFFFEDSPHLCEFIAKLFAASIINLPVCIHGPTGIGKTSAAKAFALMRPCNSRSKFQIHSFHYGTKPNHLYGTKDIINRNIRFINGPLKNALINGDTFIADEMNLSSPSTMKSLSSALEPDVAEFAFNPKFFFIACQNELGINGRNAIPESIASRFRYFEYPKLEIQSISSICCDISRRMYGKGNYPSFIKEQARKIVEYMVSLNNLQQHILPKWSLRDVIKLFQRIESSSRFKNIKIYHNVLFYTMSPVTKDDEKDILPIVIDLIAKIFVLSEDERHKLLICYEDIPRISKQDHQIFIMKGECGVMLDSSSKIAIEPNLWELPSLLQGIFMASLSDSSESILLVGPSGFKTFLSECLLPIANVISLNQETTNDTLLGSSVSLTDFEAKVFYLDQICKISGIESKYFEFIEKLKKNQLKKEDITYCIKFQYFSDSIRFAISGLIDKLFSYDNDEENKSVISSNIIKEFRPGLFLSAILQGKPLILKNLANVPTNILERFNELFSYKHNLTLNEDIYDTFTHGMSKEITNFGSNFTVIATCHPDSATNLSENVLSRFTVIYIPSYEPKEQEIAINNYITMKKLLFDRSLIHFIIDFSQSMVNHLSKAFTFTQMINAVEMCANLNRSNDDQLYNLSVILYRLVLGLLEKRKQNHDKLLAIFTELQLPLPEQIKAIMEQNPLVVTQQNEYNGVKSNITGYFINSSKASDDGHKQQSNVSFIGLFSEMLDVLHLGLVANIPVIFEGKPAQGKQTAINYIAKLIGYNVVNVNITQATKAEDLFGKVIINKNGNRIEITKTKLVKALSSDSNSIIVFHNINYASPAVLDILVSIFDRNIEYLILPNGEILEKGHLNLVGIFDPQNGMFSRDRLPSSFIFSSLYHIVDDLKSSDIFKIVQELFKNTEFKDDAKSFYEKYEKINKIASENNQAPLTLNDISKYILFRNQTINKFDETTIFQMIFAYRYFDQEIADKVLKEIDIPDMKSIPNFTYNTEKQEIHINISEEKKAGIILPLKSNNIDTEKIQYALPYLTHPQKHCLLFLACSLLSKQSCIIQGNNTSGQSYIIRLFAKMLGQKLNVYQMNREAGVSIFAGQSILINDLTDKDVKAFRKAFDDLKNIPVFNEYIEREFPQNPNEWKPSMFSDLLDVISDYRRREACYTDIKYLNSAEVIIRQTILPANRFYHQESSFIRAMLKGEWVLIDGIESAPPEFVGKILSLFGDNPEIDLNEYGEGLYFSKNNLPNTQKIHNDFHLFVTYDPTSSAETKFIDPTFVNKFLSFTLTQINSTFEYTKQIILRTLLKTSFPVDFTTSIGAQFSNITKEFTNLVDHLNQINEEQEKEIKRLREENMKLKKKEPYTDEIQFLGDDDISNLEKVGEIGFGGGGRVYKVFMRQYYALKEISTSKLNYENFQKLLNEYEIINHLHHPNIVKTFGIMMNSSKYPPSILLEYCPSNLETAIKERSLTNEKIVFSIYQIAEGMKYIHSKKIIYRDLKPTNILIATDGTIKIADFGVAKLMSAENQGMTQGVGTQKFMAPEIINEEDEYNEKVDVYSFGVVLFYILSNGELPKIKLFDILKGKKAEIPSSFTAFAKQLINDCWNFEPNDRPSFKSIVDSLAENHYDLIKMTENELINVEKFVKQNKEKIEPY